MKKGIIQKYRAGATNFKRQVYIPIPWFSSKYTAISLEDYDKAHYLMELWNALNRYAINK